MVDFNDWRAELNEQYGLADKDWDELDKSVILTFVLDQKDRVKSTYKGKHVLKHRDSEKTIMAGETWICSLTPMDTYYFAKGLIRLDSSFMFELKKEQLNEVASNIWVTQRHIIEPLLEVKYQEEINRKVASAVQDTRSIYEDEIKNLKDEIREREHKEVENKNIISSLQDKLEAAERRTPVPQPEGPFGLPLYPSSQVIAVRRDGPDSVFSESFTKSRYFVHLSADHRMIVVRPHEEGNVVCMNNKIVLDGLSMISSFSGPREMVSEYNHVYGGIQIYL